MCVCQFPQCVCVRVRLSVPTMCMCACVSVSSHSVCACVCLSVPTVKMPRMLVTSAYALQQLLKKTEMIGLSTTQVNCSTDCCLCIAGPYGQPWRQGGPYGPVCGGQARVA